MRMTFEKVKVTDLNPEQIGDMVTWLIQENINFTLDGSILTIKPNNDSVGKVLNRLGYQQQVN